MRPYFLFMTIAALFLTRAAIGAEKGDEDDPYLKVAVARAKVEIAIRESANTFDPHRSGWNSEWQGCDLAYQKAYQELHRCRDAESRKAEARNEQFLTDCNERQNALNAAWQAYQRDRQEMQRKMGDATNEFNQAVQVFRATVSSEEAWKNSKMDLELLCQIYAALEKRIKQIHSQGQAALDDLKQQRARWDEEHKVILDFATAGGHPPLAPAK